MPDLFPLNEACKLGEQVHGLVRGRPQLLAEIVALREPLGRFAVLRDLMYDDSTARHPVASSGHIVPRNADAAGEGAIPLLVMAGDPDGGLVDSPHDDPSDEDLDAMASDNAVGNGPSIGTINFDADPADFHRHDAQDASSVTSTLTPPVSPSVETQPGTAASSLTSRPVPDGPVDPVAAASAAAPRSPVDARGKAPLPGTLRRGFSLASPEARTQKTVASAERAGINPPTYGGVASVRDSRVSRERARRLLCHAGARLRGSAFTRREHSLAPVHAYTHQGERLCRPFTHAI